MRNFPLMMFAAGFGTRMKPLTKDKPKPLIKVAGRPLVDHALTLGKDAGCDPIVVNLHYKAEMLMAHLSGTGVQTVLELPDILDTGGGLRNALAILGDDPVITTNTDAVWAGPNPIPMLIQAWNPKEMDALLICVPQANAIGHSGAGDFSMSPNGRLKRGPNTIYGGIQIIKTDMLEQIEEQVFSLNLLWDRMMESERLFGMEYPGQWCDVGHPDGIKLAEDMLAKTSV